MSFDLINLIQVKERYLTVGRSGGSVLTTLLDSKYESIQNLDISVLVRGEEKGKILAEQGVKPIYFKDLDDSEALIKAASEHDSKFNFRLQIPSGTNFMYLVVINTASGFHSGAARALVLGLGERKKVTGKDVFFFHVC